MEDEQRPPTLELDRDSPNPVLSLFLMRSWIRSASSWEQQEMEQTGREKGPKDMMRGIKEDK